jgi:hypothetical protein
MRFTGATGRDLSCNTGKPHPSFASLTDTLSLTRRGVAAFDVVLYSAAIACGGLGAADEFAWVDALVCAVAECDLAGFDRGNVAVGFLQETFAAGGEIDDVDVGEIARRDRA